MAKKKLLKVSANKDYILESLLFNAHSQLSSVVAYFQKVSKYNDQYEKVFNQQKRVFKELEKLEHELAQITYKQEIIDCGMVKEGK